MTTVSTPAESRRILGAPIFLRGLGPLLLATAWLKIDSFLQGDNVPLPPALALFAVEAELVLGFWLISGFAASRALRATLICFCAFAGIALYFWIRGVSNCGCAGRIQISPGWCSCSISSSF